MRNLTAETAIQYANSRPELRGKTWTAARLLGGGVSNAVVLVEGPAERMVFKQSLGRLRVAEEWLADQSRNLRESASMSEVAALLPAGSVPRVILTDADNFIYAMEAAPQDALDWKTRLLGTAEGLPQEQETARSVARILAALINGTRSESPVQAQWRQAYGDQHCFDQLRLDPYYRFTSSRHPDLRRHFDECIERCRCQAQSLVHGDFSPKNILVRPGAGGPILIDFEVIHYGDPGFDAAFLLNHLLLKAAHGVGGARQLGIAFWRELAGLTRAVEGLEQSTLRHLGCLHLARVDGKSPAEYLTQAERERVRAAAFELIVSPPRTIEEVFAG